MSPRNLAQRSLALALTFAALTGTTPADVISVEVVGKVLSNFGGSGPLATTALDSPVRLYFEVPLQGTVISSALLTGIWNTGETRYFQAWYADTAGSGSPCSAGFNATNALSVVLNP